MTTCCDCYIRRRDDWTEKELLYEDAMVYEKHRSKTCREWILIALFPIMAGLIWTATLTYLGLSFALSPAAAHMHISFVSDVAASTRQRRDVFLWLNVATCTFVLGAIMLERVLRGRGFLSTNKTLEPLAIAFLSIFAALVGITGLVGLSYYDVLADADMHNRFVITFLAGFLVLLLLTLVEYYRHTGYNWVWCSCGNSCRCGCTSAVHYRTDHRVPFWLQVLLLAADIAMLIAFIYYGEYFRGHYKNENLAVDFEWVSAALLALHFFFYTWNMYLALKICRERQHVKGEKMI